MRYLFMTVCLVLVASTAAIEQCLRAVECNDDFTKKATSAGSDKETFCRYIREKVECLDTVRSQCPQQQQEWVGNEKRTTLDKYPDCASGYIVQSSVVVTFFLVAASMAFSTGQ